MDFQVLLLEKKEVSPVAGMSFGAEMPWGGDLVPLSGDICPHLGWALGDEAQELTAGHRSFIQGPPTG